MADISLHDEIPGNKEYRALRLSAGLSPKTAVAATRGLPRSLYAVCLRQGSKLIGMGRIVGDGGCNYEIVDVAVDPEFQRQGHGSAIMAALVAYLDREAPSSAYVSLIADHGAPALYRKFGFEPTAPASIGMAMTMPKDDQECAET